MSKILSIFEKEIKIFFKDIKTNIIFFIIFPLALSFFYGLFQKEVFNPKRALSTINVSLVDKDNGELSKTFKNIFKSKELKAFINITEHEENSDCTIKIPENFSKNLMEGKNTNIEIEKYKKSADFEFFMLETISNNFIKVINTNSNVVNTINNSSISMEEKQKAIDKYSKYIIELSKTNILESKEVKEDKTLTSDQYFSSSILGFFSMIVIMSICQNFLKRREDGTLKRLCSTSVKKREIYLGKLFFYFIINLITISSYILIKGIQGIAFGKNPLLLILSIITHSIFITGIAGLVIGFFKDSKMANIILNFVIIICALFSGAFYSINIVKESSPFIAIISRFTPNYWIQSIYQNLMYHNSLNGIVGVIVIMIIIGISAGAIGMVKLDLNWED